MKKLFYLMPLLLIFGCQQKPKSLVEQHLEYLKSGDTGKAQAQYCATDDNLRLSNVLNYELLSTSTKTQDGLTYTEVKASVTQGKLQQEVKSQIAFEIWKPKDHFELAKITNQKLAEFGIAPVIKEENWSKQSECIYVPFEEN